MKDSIIFIDWGGTLSERRFWDMNPELYKCSQTNIFTVNKALVREWMLGIKTMEDVCRYLSESSSQSIEFIREELKRGCEDTGIRTDLLEQIRRIRSFAWVVLATDNMDCFERYTRKTLRLDHHFDDVLISCVIGRMKNDDNGLTFRGYANSRNIPLSRCHLIDDSEDTCALFESLGGKSFRTCSEIDTVERLKEMKI